MLEGLKERLLAPELVAAFMTAMQAELGRYAASAKPTTPVEFANTREMDQKIAGLMRAIEDGLYEPAMKTRMLALQTDRQSLAVEPADAG